MQNSGKYKMFLGILVLITALSISGIAIYYSVAGLVAIFAAAAIPIIIMGGALEIGKLVTAVWLHKYWRQCVWWLKTYLTVAVVVLMFITSMGIFGFLSKAHIEQTSLSQEQIALIDTLNDKETRSQAKIERWRGELDRLLKGEDVRVDSLIEKDQEGLDKIYARIKEAKDALRADAKFKVEQQQTRIKQAQDRRDAEIAAAEKKFEGTLGGTKAYEDAVKKAKDNELSVASRAQAEILKINTQLDADLKAVDEKYAKETVDINNRISDLRNQANSKTQDIEGRITELEGFIETEQKVIDEVREEKFGYEKQYRKLEAEVGPIKYIAEFIYGESANNDLLEEAVRWVIIIIIFVFDPLAVLLLIASQYTFDFNRRIKDDGGNRLRQQPEKKETKDQEIIDNPDYITDDTEEEVYQDENTTREITEEESQDVEELRDGQNQERIQAETGDDPVVVEEQEDPVTVQEALESIEPKEIDVEKKDQKSSEESERLTEEEFDALDTNDEWKTAKTSWKKDNPNETLKEYKDLYLNGVIDDLPWEEYLPEGVDLKKKKRYIMKKDGKQIRKETEE